MKYAKRRYVSFPRALKPGSADRQLRTQAGRMGAKANLAVDGERQAGIVPLCLRWDCLTAGACATKTNKNVSNVPIPVLTGSGAGRMLSDR